MPFDFIKIYFNLTDESDRQQTGSLD